MRLPFNKTAKQGASLADWATVLGIGGVVGGVPGAVGGYLTSPEDQKLRGTLLGAGAGAVAAPLSVAAVTQGLKRVPNLPKRLGFSPQDIGLTAIYGTPVTGGLAGLGAGQLLSQYSSDKTAEIAPAIAYQGGKNAALNKLGFLGTAATKLAPIASKALNNISKVKMPSMGSMATDAAMGIAGKAMS